MVAHRLPSASLEALQPSPAGLKSVQTSFASPMQGRHTRGLSSTSSTKHEDFGGCAESERLFFGALEISVGKLSNVKFRVFNCGELRGQVHELQQWQENDTIKRLVRVIMIR